ncbi:MAG: ModD protein [Crenarchaeota archaeon]|nr:ModD protein [Thermoproteota archaeon]
MRHSLSTQWVPDDKLEEWLREDSYPLDLTSFALNIHGKAVARVITREKSIVACTEEAARLYMLAGAERVRRLVHTGATVTPGQILLEVVGDAYSLHKAWRVAQTIIAVFSGVATRTRRFVELIRKHGGRTVLATTRKTLPGLRPLYIKSVIAGGGVPHRLGLYDSILVFPNHKRLIAAKTAEELVQMVKQVFPEKPVTIEAKSLDEAIEAIDAGADAVQLDKLAPSEVREIIDYIRRKHLNTKVIVAGNIGIDNIEDYARLEPDIIVSSAPYYGKPIDITTTIERI